MPRKTKLNQQIIEQLSELIANGCTVTDACDLVGIHISSYYNWFNAGQELDESAKGTNKLYFEFFESITHARARANQKAVDAVQYWLQSQETKKEIVEVFSETRIGKNGEPYEYIRKKKRIETNETAPDWRAGIEFLKRRNPQDWGEHSTQHVVADVHNTHRDADDIDIKEARARAKLLMEKIIKNDDD